ncbi:LA_3751/LA_3752 family putative glycosyltransferase [Leptospira stimsonii]|uniref:Glycosyltransferase RgtA/B/C/D-like domain-containing protein n=1 Tax=Leptospira stimsonii TaxID=2202203 RepID=A0ABY2MY75_9LEPT|nr:hypothetical protein [Leptospira stimsonii]TGK14382.1 hypothetical protein EHO98_16005 [Leptospira stimsonii]TGM11745.1 hypothetical protein EHQ90_16180 [Leptospira stimsonii]
MLNRLTHPYARYILYLFVFGFLLFNRSKLDRFFPFVSSDSQIKYYQTISFAQNGMDAITKSECIYPGQNLDPDFRFFPFDYPWAFLKNTSRGKCLFQYPALFAMANGLPAYLFGPKIITFLPLLCLFACMIVFDRILSSFIKYDWAILLGTLVPFGISFPLLSAEEFSEVPLNNLLLLSFGLLLLRSVYIDFVDSERRTEDSHFRIFSFCSGLIAVTAFFLRTESVFPIFLFGILSFFQKESRENLKEYLIFSISGAALGIVTIGILNFAYSGHPMGIRFLVSSGDAVSQFSLPKQISIFQGYLFGDETKTGFLKAAPYTILILGIISNLIRKKKLSGESLFGLVGLGTVFSISFLSPYTAGVHHFGLRYLESGYFFLSAGIFIFLYHRSIEFPKAGIVLVLLTVVSLYYNYKFTREGFKILFGAITPYNEIQKEFLKRKIIVHKGQFTNYLIGSSYLTAIHLSVNSSKDALDLEEILTKQNIESYSILEYDLVPPRDPNLPEKQYQEKIAVRFPDPDRFYKKMDEKKILDFTLKTYSLR